MHEVHPLGVGPQPIAGHVERLRVTVDADQGERWMGAEQHRRVATETHRGIDHHGWPAHQRRLEQLEGSG
jgi:hypothetical protein